MEKSEELHAEGWFDLGSVIIYNVEELVCDSGRHILNKHSSLNGMSKAKATLKIHLKFFKLKRFIEK